MTIDEINILNQKAETKKNGVYSFRGNLWVVIDKKFVAYSDPCGNCYQRCGFFNYNIGKVESYKRKEELKKWMLVQPWH